MEHMGWWAIVPPVLTIVLALVTKDVILSLFLGIMSGTLIATGGDLFAAIVLFSEKLVANLGDSWNLRIFLFCALLGGLVGLLSRAGASQAFGDWAARHVKTRTGTLITTWIFGLLVFIDDYFNSLAVGTAMRPVTDRMKISRAKLAYILDSTAAPVCILAPVSTWVVTVMSYMRGSEGFGELGMGELELFIRTIPYNFYAIFAILMVLGLALTHRDFGPMLTAERRACDENKLYDENFGFISGDLHDPRGVFNIQSREKVRPIDMFLPMLVLVLSALAAFPVTTWWNAAITEGGPTTFLEAVRTIPVSQGFWEADASMSLMICITFTLMVTVPYMLARRLFSPRMGSEAFVVGVKSMVPALLILAMAWTIGAVIKEAPADGGMGLPAFLTELVERGGMTGRFLPVGLFIISALIACSTGTSWGTMAIMIPIGIPLAMAIAERSGGGAGLLLPEVLMACGAVLGGAVMGDHISPISDTTILSAIGAGCPLLEHVTTQAPYAIFVAVCTGVGYLIGGITKSGWIGFCATLAFFLLGLVALPRLMPGGGKDS
ncbi:MAG: Na+/H+ antiporter NhaC family protein [Verrucomicrobiota bacterium]|jgi:Na+/H+ antiporter NhaC|nr:Na+/H+ antiporter NhaC family protein [Verrucomicrobiota bacterium]